MIAGEASLLVLASSTAARYDFLAMAFTTVTQDDYSLPGCAVVSVNCIVTSGVPEFYNFPHFGKAACSPKPSVLYCVINLADTIGPGVLT
jgi:hypothetical protein